MIRRRLIKRMLENRGRLACLLPDLPRKLADRDATLNADFTATKGAPATQTDMENLSAAHDLIPAPASVDVQQAATQAQAETMPRRWICRLLGEQAKRRQGHVDSD